MCYRNMWGAANPGYQLRDGFQLQSVMKQDYVWDQAEVSPGFGCVNVACNP